MVLTEYVITPRTKRNAERLDLLVYPSENLKYKMEVYNDNGLFLGYVGLAGSIDFCKMRFYKCADSYKIRKRWVERNRKDFEHNKLLDLEYNLLWR